MYRMVPADSQDNALAQLRKGTLEYCVLALLREEPRYGFDLVKTLGEVEGMLTSQGTVYPLLTRLRREELVATEWQESPEGPPRKYYRLTPKGRRALRNFVEEWHRFKQAVDHFIERRNEDG